MARVSATSYRMTISPRQIIRATMIQDLKALTADIVTAHVGSNKVSLTELPGLISSVYRALAETSTPSEPEPPKQKPAVPIPSSVKPD